MRDHRDSVRRSDRHVGHRWEARPDTQCSPTRHRGRGTLVHSSQGKSASDPFPLIHGAAHPFRWRDSPSPVSAFLVPSPRLAAKCLPIPRVCHIAAPQQPPFHHLLLPSTASSPSRRYNSCTPSPSPSPSHPRSHFQSTTLFNLLEATETLAPKPATVTASALRCGIKNPLEWHSSCWASCDAVGDPANDPSLLRLLPFQEVRLSETNQLDPLTTTFSERLPSSLSSSRASSPVPPSPTLQSISCIAPWHAQRS